MSQSSSPPPQRDEIEQALAAAMLQPSAADRLLELAATEPGRRFVVAELTRCLPIQDWDAIETLLPVCRERPDASYAAPLAAILDRQSLEISNSLVIEALGRTGSSDAEPALRRALERTSVPHPDWKPDRAGLEEADGLRGRCEEALRALEHRAGVPGASGE